MYHMVDHKVNKDQSHTSAKVNETIYRIGWIKNTKDDTWEPIHHISRKAIVKYYDKRNLSYPTNILHVLGLKRDGDKLKQLSSYKKQITYDGKEKIKKTNGVPETKPTTNIESDQISIMILIPQKKNAKLRMKLLRKI